jgi:hypothetical protein
MAPYNYNERFLNLLAFSAVGKKYADFPKEGLLTTELLSPDYVPPSRASELIATVGVLTPIAVGVVLVRLYVNRYTPGLTIGWEGICIMIATVILLGFTALIIFGIKIGIGRHAYDESLDELGYALQASEAYIQLYIWAMYFVKLSNLFFVRRITPHQFRGTHRVLYGFFT